MLLSLQRLLAVKRERAESAEKWLLEVQRRRERQAEQLEACLCRRRDAQQHLDEQLQRRMTDPSLRESFLRFKVAQVRADVLNDALTAKEQEVHAARKRLVEADAVVEDATRKLQAARRDVEKAEHCYRFAQQERRQQQRRRDEAESDASVELRTMRSASIEKVI